MKGRCVICGALGKLTRDHVPPKGVARPKPVAIARLTSLLEPKEYRPKPRRGFQAPHFPTLCEDCNVRRLGSLYDPVLARFANDLAQWLKLILGSDLLPPGDPQIDTKPHLLARSVVNHLLAAEERSSPTAPLSTGTLIEAMRSFLLNPDSPWPSDFHLSCWPYLGKQQVIVRGFAISRLFGRRYGPIVGDLLKFYPLAFWVTNISPDVTHLSFGHIPLAPLPAADTIRPVRVPVRGKPALRWPEAPGDDEAVVLSMDRTSVATPSS